MLSSRRTVGTAQGVRLSTSSLPSLGVPTRINSFLSFAAVLLLALSFPIQVYSNSPYPSLVPYLLIGINLILNVNSPAASRRIRNSTQSQISPMVVGYSLLVLLTTGSQIAFSVISVDEALAAFVTYVLPVGFYYHFRRRASEREIRSVLIAIAIAGLISGMYFAYDSYLKLALNQVNDYATRAFQYSLDRSGALETEANIARVSIVGRSQGLLQSQSVSGSWVALGAFAALALLPINQTAVRRLVVLVFGAILALGLNFTSILAFASIMLLFEFGGLSGLRGHFLRFALNMFPLALVIAAVRFLTLWISGDGMSGFAADVFYDQVDWALGRDAARASAIELICGAVNSYLRHIGEFPFTLLFGDGFSSFGLMKAGDVGFVDTLAKFGLPFYLAVILGLGRLVAKGLRDLARDLGRDGLDRANNEPISAIQFAICVTLLVFISDFHYSVWSAKSILPIVFFALALYDRYLQLPSSFAFQPNEVPCRSIQAAPSSRWNTVMGRV